MGRDLLRRAGIGRISTAWAAWCALMLVAGVAPASAVETHSADAATTTIVPAAIPSPAELYHDRSVRRTFIKDVWNSVSSDTVRPSAKPLPSRQTHEGPMVYSLNVRTTPLLDAYLRKYEQPAGHKWLQNALDRGAPYRDFIRSRLAAAHLPPELYYLALIESTFAVHAVSRSGAVGMWQFMENSVGNWMTISDWVDERRDFWKSTEAAIEKLTYNYSVLKDWLLAVAAYNAGLGFMTRLVDRTGIHDFWKLEQDGYLPPETAAYVPKFLAVAAVGSYPGRNGLETDWAPPLRWVRIPLHGPVDLSVLARRAAIPLSVLREGNAELNYGITPPGGHALKVPERYRAAAEAAISGSSVDLVRVHEHTVESGDTFWNISRRFGVPIEMLQRFNPGVSAHALKLGARLVIPIVQGSPDPAAVERAEARKQHTIPVGDFSHPYTVRHGDTLWNISKRFGTTPEDLALANRLKIDSVLSIGQTLNVPAANAEN